MMKTLRVNFAILLLLLGMLALSQADDKDEKSGGNTDTTSSSNATEATGDQNEPAMHVVSIQRSEITDFGNSSSGAGNKTTEELSITNGKCTYKDGVVTEPSGDRRLATDEELKKLTDFKKQMESFSTEMRHEMANYMRKLLSGAAFSMRMEGGDEGAGANNTSMAFKPPQAPQLPCLCKEGCKM